MSTFDGFVAEFPRIRVDYFCLDPSRPAPLACFLSHVHSDHLRGLMSLRAPFVYCSAATRELLLRLEKYPHRINFARGILERRKQEYSHLRNLLKPLPLDTPVEIELGYKKKIRVTLFDANHCPGAVMFLIEGDGKTILYTGDVRAEPWWVESLRRNPVLIPYVSGLYQIDKLYLDTTFAASNRRLFAEFPSKADGISELLRKVSTYPPDTVFHFNSWTFGYEEALIALASAFKAKIHVDKYKFRVYGYLASHIEGRCVSREGPPLVGFRYANRMHEGCFTEEEDAKFHICERESECKGLLNKKVVWIRPVVSRTSDGEEVLEQGAGGGYRDTTRVHELEFEDADDTTKLLAMLTDELADKDAISRVSKLINRAASSLSKALFLTLPTVDESGNKVSIRDLIGILSDDALTHETQSQSQPTVCDDQSNSINHITFPYSRHSSYKELCDFISAFRPKDIYPCTVDEENWDESKSIRALFGSLCSGTRFVHDAEIRMRKMSSTGKKRKRQDNDDESQESQDEANEQTLLLNCEPLDESTQQLLTLRAYLRTLESKDSCIQSDELRTKVRQLSSSTFSDLITETCNEINRRQRSRPMVLLPNEPGSETRSSLVLSSRLFPEIGFPWMSESTCKHLSVSLLPWRLQDLVAEVLNEIERRQSGYPSLTADGDASSQVRQNAIKNHNGTVNGYISDTIESNQENVQYAVQQHDHREYQAHKPDGIISSPTVMKRMEPTKSGVVSKEKENDREIGVEKKLYQCKWSSCLSKTETLQSLQHHISTQHSIPVTVMGQPIFYCLWQQCDNNGQRLSFYSKAEFKKHLDSCHLQSEIGEMQMNNHHSHEKLLTTEDTPEKEGVVPAVMQEISKTATSVAWSGLEHLPVTVKQSFVEDIAESNNLTKAFKTLLVHLDEFDETSIDEILKNRTKESSSMTSNFWRCGEENHGMCFEDHHYLTKDIDELRRVVPTAFPSTIAAAIKACNGAIIDARTRLAIEEMSQLVNELRQMSNTKGQFQQPRPCSDETLNGLESESSTSTPIEQQLAELLEHEDDEEKEAVFEAYMQAKADKGQWEGLMLSGNNHSAEEEEL